MKRLFAVLLTILVYLWIGGWQGSRVLAGGCICGGQNCTAYTTDPYSNQLVCADSGSQSYCCATCGGGAGCGVNNSNGNACTDIGLQMYCPQPTVYDQCKSIGYCRSLPGNSNPSIVCDTKPNGTQFFACQTGCWCAAACTVSSPAAVTLASPANGASVSGTSVNLMWSAPTSWGTACPSNSNQYQVYVDNFNPPTTIRSAVADGVTNVNFTGVRGTTYYWKVLASNGQMLNTSPVWSFTILDNQIQGTVYNDPGNTCSQATPWSGGGTVTVGSATGTIAANGTYSVTATGNSSYIASLSMPAGYTCSTGALCGVCPDRSGIASPSTGNNFFITNNKAAWWQAAGGPVYAGSPGAGVTIRSQLPTASSALILPGAGGTVGALLRSTGSVDLGSGIVSSTGWSTKSTYHGRVMNYDYFAAQMGVAKNQANDWLGGTLDKPTYDPTKDFWYSPATSDIANPWTVGATEKYVVFVNGDLNIKNNITVANGGFLAFIVKGNIVVDPGVTAVQGIYVANGNFATLSIYSLGVTNDAPLAVQGSVAVWGNMDLRRNLGGAGNIDPGEQFDYRPDLLTSMPDKLKTFAMQWQEVPAGTF